MRNASDFKRELAARRGLDESHVVTALASSDDEDLRDRWALDAAQFGFQGYDQGIIMAEGERNLFSILAQEDPSFEELRVMLREVLLCIKHLHDRGVVHADIKPMNVSRGVTEIHKGNV